MKKWLFPLVGAGFLALGLVGFGSEAVSRGEMVLYCVIGASIYAGVLMRLTYYREGARWPKETPPPTPYRLTWVDYLKALVSWLNAFKRTYAVRPGLYYTGEAYDAERPLLVTSNYALTVFLVVRRLKGQSVRLLVVDTDGINVWCAAGKGVFSNKAIMEQVNRYDRDILGSGKWLKLIVPKFGFSGVDLRSLRDERIRPIIGPLYAKDLASYLADTPLRDRETERVHFGIQSRLFTWLPGLVQTMSYSLALILVFLFVGVTLGRATPWGLVTITVVVATIYPLFFPWLPGRGFAAKGLSLAVVFSLFLVVFQATDVITTASFVMGVFFTFGAAILFGLSYSGNSAVSNYVRVRKEIARFLPLNLALFVTSLVLFVVMGVQR